MELDSFSIGTLGDMADETVPYLSGLRGDIAYIEYEIEQIQEEIEALEDALSVCAQATAYYLENDKLTYLSRTMYFVCQVVYGPEFGITNVSDWVILNSNQQVIYSYASGINWDNDPHLLAWIQDFNYIYDLLNAQHLTPTDGMYGKYETLNTLLQVKGINNKDFDKIGKLGTIIDRYIGNADGDESQYGDTIIEVSRALGTYIEPSSGGGEE